MGYFAETLFSLARNGIETGFSQATEFIKTFEPEYSDKGASFVTLTLNGALRGCVGSIIAHQALGADIQSNGFNAAFKDFRFSPLTEEEYEDIVVEVSILTPLERVSFFSENELRSIIRPGIDGVIYNCRGRRATFLPQVWEQLPDFDSFFSHLSMKAGLGPTPDFSDCSIDIYQVQKYHE